MTSREYRFSRLFNFRDLGGARTADGHTVRHGQVYRSDSLHGLDDADRDLWRELGIHTVLDLRRPAEVDKYGRVPDWDGVRWEHVYLRHQDWARVPWQGRTDLVDYLEERYLAMAGEGAEDIATAMSVIADPAAAPLVVHCMAGKDRTGLLCALTLSLLGVPDEDVAAEYALTSPNMARLRARLEAAQPGRTDLDEHPLDAPAQAMSRTLAGLRAKHGSIENYLRDIGLPDDAGHTLRKHLLR